MAGELSYTSSGTYTKNGVTEPLPGVTNLSIAVSGNTVSGDVIATSTGGVAVPLNGLTSPFGVMTFKNLDPTNTITIKDASSGHVFMTLLPGECWSLRAGSDITAPTAVASASTPLLQYKILPP